MLTVLILTKNSEKYICYVLRQVIKIADEIIVIDGGSTDNTISILKNFPVKIFYKHFEGFGKDRVFALSKAHGDWVCFIDSDEVLTNELIQEISNIINSSTYDIIYFNTLTFFRGKIMKCWSGPRLKLFKKNFVQFPAKSLVHESAKIKKHAKKYITKHFMLHFFANSFLEHWNKAVRYNKLKILEYRRYKLTQGNTFKLVVKFVLIRPLVTPLARLIKDRMVVDGIHGLFAALSESLAYIIAFLFFLKESYNDKF